MLNALLNFIVFIFSVGLLIAVHEFGHFLTACLFGVKVERFSIGFGKTLLRYVDKQGTEYILALIPLGGYVKMLNVRSISITSSFSSRAFNKKNILQRMAIIIAGPLANFIFSVFLYWIIFIIGMPGVRPVIDRITISSPAEEAHFTRGMEIKAVDGIITPDWDAVRMAFLKKIGDDTARVTVTSLGRKNNSEKIINLRSFKGNIDKKDFMQLLGMEGPGPHIDLVLDQVEKNSAASRAGLRPGDIIVKVSGKLETTWNHFAEIVRDNPNKALYIEVERAGSNVRLVLTPDINFNKKNQGFAGLVPRVRPLSEEYRITYQYLPLVALGKAVSQTWQFIQLTVNILSKLVNGEIGLSNLSGPISIAQSAGQSVEYGFKYYLMFLARISVNLGVMNLLPLLGLDGGHLLCLLIEKIKGQPLSQGVQEFSYRISFIILIILMGLAIFNDFSYF
ncbi:Regulator of sigma-E protease RseP [Candidatus Erwinia haradaeae]|uniref:Zinc metalloprotease n=1 Tax=Candidatus Erwinia haradaeae TaxID=1922217 RepID=A0A451CZI4_9GAMM|nr:sigma E protease regulator RseP [Candidatus Erwinia haradaeae]VFP78572.1 Regulator of sigma-E protease RseP [Candidatus Erwinia haradaeae]